MPIGRWPLKISLLLAYLAFDHEAIAARALSLGLSPALLFYIGLFGCLALLLLGSAAIRPTWLRVAVAALLSTSAAFLHAVEWTTGDTMTYEVFANLYNARGNAGDALAQHAAIASVLVPAALLLFAGLALPPGRGTLPGKAALAPPAAAILLLSVMLYVRGGEGTRAVPAPFTPLAYVPIMGFEEARAADGPRQGVTIPRVRPPASRDIVLIVDESVSGNYLAINNPHGVPTPLDRPPAGVALTNYGYAVSIHNCSATTNLALRYGGTRDNYRETIARAPSIWAYARHAGLRTVYLDAQETGGTLQNLMTPAEREEIDDFVQFDSVPVIARDMAIADALARRLGDGRAEFIYVNKAGAHFPVRDKYPEAFSYYRPALARGRPSLISWTSDRSGFEGRRDEWVRYRNSYRNTLLWNVGAFFERLFARADLSHATIVYTSDHGQDLREAGHPGNNPHCGNKNPRQEEGVVPLLVIEAAGRQSLPWRASLPGNHNGMSHYRIFPTLLALMGYRGEAVRRTYGPSLVDADKDPFTLNLLFNALLAREPDWKRIDVATIASPPASDHQPR